MLFVYSSVSSYADRGVAISLGGRLRIAFQTSFVRGSCFRFEFVGEHDPMVVWSDGAHTYTQWHRPTGTEIIDDGADIARAISAAKGVSSGTSNTVPAMLLPVSIGAVCGSLAELGELVVVGEESIGGRSCSLINGCDPRAEHRFTTIWIDRESHLLRRIRLRCHTRFETTTSYEPWLVPFDVSNIERPGIEIVPPQPREPVPVIGIRIATGSRRIEKVVEGSPAMRSGLAIDDEVEAVNGQCMKGFVDVLKALHFAKIGDRLELVIRRDDSIFTVAVQVEQPPSRAIAAPSSPLVE
jgi:hypothetical protein